MDDRTIDIDIELLRLYQPIAESAHLSIEQIAKKLAEINLLNEKEELSIEYKEEVYELLISMHAIHSRYEEFKGRVIAYIKSKNNTKVELGANTLRIDERANVIIINQSDGEQIVL